MKKHNDGYVLPFVLVVLVVVCLVAVSLMSNSLSNLQRQQASIERMQDKYTAMGKIEKIEGTTASAAGCSAETCPCISGTSCACTDNLKNNAITNLLANLKSNNLTIEYLGSSGEVKVTAKSDKVTITATYKITIDTFCFCTTGTCSCKDENGVCTCSCAATATVGKCTSYTISTEEVTE